MKEDDGVKRRRASPPVPSSPIGNFSDGSYKPINLCSDDENYKVYFVNIFETLMLFLSFTYSKLVYLSGRIEHLQPDRTYLITLSDQF